MDKNNAFKAVRGAKDPPILSFTNGKQSEKLDGCIFKDVNLSK